MYKVVFALAWKSLIGRIARMWMVIIMIALSLSGLLFLEGLYDGMVSHMIDTTIRNDTGDISIYAKQYRLEKNIQYHVDDTKDIKEYLDHLDGVDSYVVRLTQEGLISTAHKSFNVNISGIDLKDEQRFGRLDEFIVDGKFDFGPKNQDAIIGSKLAEKLKVKVGSRLVFTAQDAAGEINSISFRVRGIVKTGNMSIDEGSIFIPMDIMTRFIGLRSSATQIAIHIKDRSMINATQLQLQKHFKDLDVLKWDEIYPLYQLWRKMLDITNLLSYGIVFAVAALGIFGVVMVSILERMREFSIMLAIGTPYKMIRGQIIVEAFIMAVLGYILGVVLGSIFLAYGAYFGIDLRYFKAGMESFGLNAILYCDIHYYYFYQAFGAVIFATALSVLWPLYILKKINIIETIQGKML
jgi:putative ABC transport system permease protein